MTRTIRGALRSVKAAHGRKRECRPQDSEVRCMRFEGLRMRASDSGSVEAKESVHVMAVASVAHARSA
jgi:hypothetical protein